MANQSALRICVTLLTAIAVFTVLRYAKDLFAPVITALLLGIVMTPLSDLMDRMRIPSALAAFVSVTLALLSILLLILLIEPYVTQVIDRAPVIWNELRTTVDELKRIMRGIEEMTEDVAAAIEASPNTEEGGPVALPSLTDALFLAPQFAAQIMIFTGTLYFFLMARNGIYDWVSASFASFGESDLRYAAKQVSRYVLTISMINLGFGVLVTIIMQLIGMPSPIVWGVLAFALNFVLYLGPAVLIATLLVAGIVVFDGAASFLPAAIYLTLNATEAQFVTPTLVGKSLAVNPLLVFLSLVFWLWLWGPIGGIIAIPLLVWSLSVLKGLSGQTISSGTPGKLRASSEEEPIA